MTDNVRTNRDMATTVAKLVSGYSLEVTPKEVRRSPGLLRALLPANTRVYITFLPSTPFDDTVAAAAHVVEQGLRPVPHLAARSVADEVELDRMIGRMAGVGVTELLVIAGSVSRPLGTITDSMQVLRSGLLTRHGITRVGVAGHPEGNHEIGDRALARALRDKNHFARDSGCEMYLLTQFCFAAAPIVAWERTIRAAGNRLPLHVGLPGLSSPVALLKFGVACGVGPSLKVLRKQAGGVLKLATTPVYHPDQTLVELARAIGDDPESKIANIHFFPFSAVRATSDWAGQLSAGRFRIDEPRNTISLVDVRNTQC